jgi:hypothetical protein
MTFTWIPDCWRWKISALFEPQLHNAHACNFYRDPFLSKNSLALPFTWRGGRWTPALARTTSLRKSVLPFMWLLPGLLPQQEFLLCRKVFCHSCDFYLGACLCKISFATWKCSAILVTSTRMTAYARTPSFVEKCSVIHVISTWIPDY